MLGQIDTARHLLQEVLETYLRVDNRYGGAYTTYMLGHVARRAGQLNEAIPLLRSAATELLDMGDTDSVALCVETLAGIMVDRSNPSDAARLLGLAKSMREQTGSSIPGTRLAEVTQDTEAARAALGEETLAVKMAEGAKLDPIDTITQL